MLCWSEGLSWILLSWRHGSDSTRPCCLSLDVLEMLCVRLFAWLMCGEFVPEGAGLECIQRVFLAIYDAETLYRTL